jgi:putative transposase
MVSDEALAELRRGWCLGEKSFADRILAAISGAGDSDRKKSSVGGPAARAHDEAEAERIVTKALSALGLPEDAGSLTGRGKWKLEKDLVAALVRKRTGMGNAWVAARLGMGHEVSVTRAVRRTREDKAARGKLNELEATLGI